MIQMKNLLATLFALLLLVNCGNTPTETNNGTEDATNEKIATKGSNTAFSDGKYQINQELSTCNWIGTEITTETHTGTLNVYKGSVQVTDNRVSSGFIAMDMASLNVTDLSGRAKDRLEGHLKSDDFFGVDKHPFAELKLESVKTKEGQSFAGGILVIRGINHPISFPVDVIQDGNQLTFDGDMTFDRSKYNVKFRSGTFPDLFPDLGDKLINDEISLSFHIVAES
ncbi:MAG: lipid-binding protein [Crocinitomicaceae bacterium]|jgi:polyisoprenoid-binding protein YceI|nr:lipid-binding protein [Crocinitomicaceae bacterium]|tara:strand:+ start:3504 stop:4181 length:678 start_codon:yes stop_codon:yes gene_type:complete